GLKFNPNFHIPHTPSSHSHLHSYSGARSRTERLTVVKGDRLTQPIPRLSLVRFRRICPKLSQSNSVAFESALSRDLVESVSAETRSDQSMPRSSQKLGELDASRESRPKKVIPARLTPSWTGRLCSPAAQMEQPNDVVHVGGPAWAPTQLHPAQLPCHPWEEACSARKIIMRIALGTFRWLNSNLNSIFLAFHLFALASVLTVVHGTLVASLLIVEVQLNFYLYSLYNQTPLFPTLQSETESSSTLWRLKSSQFDSVASNSTLGQDCVRFVSTMTESDNSDNSSPITNSSNFVEYSSTNNFAEPEQMENNDRTLKELATPDVLEPAQSYELKSSLIHLLPKFHGLVGEDPHKNLKEFNVIYSIMRPQGIPKDYIKMKAFPFSLDGATKGWLYLQLVLFNTWGDMKHMFMEKFFLASRTTTIRKEICGIRQHSRETLHEY
ncbi:hypothetical protein CR513_31234, partial [Mucuna pruriens]